MNIIWYYQRLKSMCLVEIVWRTRRFVLQVWAKLLRKWSVRQVVKNVSNTTQIVEMVDEVHFFGLDNINPNDVSEQWRTNTLSEADKLLEHRCSCFVVDDIYLGRGVNWNHELRRDIDTPLDFAPWMDYRDTNLYGHFKYFWELGRFQHLVTLSKAYYLTSDRKYADEVAKQLDSFVRQCPYLLGVHWIMPMEVGLRLLSVAWIVAFMRDYLRNDVGTCGIIEQIVLSHVNYVAGNYSLYSSANNHLIGELAGVFIASLCFGDLKEVAHHKHKAYEMLCREILLQFYSDGVNKEQTSHYHVSCYNCFLLAGLLGRENSLEFPQEYWDRLEKAADFICALSNDYNSIFNIGDSDDGKTIVLSELEPNQVQSLLATSAVLFKRGDFKAKAKYFDEMSLWLLGRTGKQVFDALDPDEKKTLPEKFEEGGYYILSDNSASKAKIIFDCGPLGFGSIAAHGHADALSFMLYVDGCQFFIDPGTYTFEAENPYRNYFRSTAAHNTISIDGKDQSEMAGAFLWGHKANSHVEEWVSNDDFVRVTASHDGYMTLDDPVTHRRTVELDKNRQIVNISDHIEANSSHEVCAHFHLAPECEISQAKTNCWKIRNGERAIQLTVDERFECEVISECQELIGGWASEHYDTKTPISTLRCRLQSQGSERLFTMIQL